MVRLVLSVYRPVEIDLELTDGGVGGGLLMV